MIKKLFPTLALCGLVTLASCSKEEVEAKMNEAASHVSASFDDLKAQVKDLDLSALSPEAVKEKVKELGSGLSAKLGEIKDEASAQKIKDAVQPFVDKLAGAKDLLGDKMPTMDSLKQAVADIKSKFANNEQIMSVLQPLIDKLQALFQ